MKISRTVMYGIHAALLLKDTMPGQSRACSELATAGQMPERFLLQILRSTVTHGVLISSRGVNGGYCLAKSLQDISVLDVMESLEGHPEHARSPFPFLSAASQQILDQANQDTNDSYQAVYAGIKLSQLTLQNSAQWHVNGHSR